MNIPVRVFHSPELFVSHPFGCGVLSHESMFKLIKKVAGDSKDPFGKVISPACSAPAKTDRITKLVWIQS